MSVSLSSTQLASCVSSYRNRLTPKKNINLRTLEKIVAGGLQFDPDGVRADKALNGLDCHVYLINNRYCFSTKANLDNHVKGFIDTEGRRYTCWSEKYRDDRKRRLCKRSLQAYAQSEAFSEHCRPVPISFEKCNFLCVKIFFPYMEKGSLMQMLIDARKVKPYPLSREVRVDYARQLIAALEKIHAAGVVHGDFKLENSVVNASNQVGIIDFEFSFLLADQMRDSLGFTGDYAAPEYHRPEPLTEKIDIWALGCALWLLLVYPEGYKPHPNYRWIQAGIIELEKSNTFTPSFPQLLAAIFQQDASKRPSAAEVLKEFDLGVYVT